MATETTTKVHVKVLSTSNPTLPPLVLQVTQMVDTYMLWIGVAGSNTNTGDGERAVLNGNLCKDWACAMPPRTAGAASAATSLFRSSSSDVALSMAQRLGKRAVMLLAPSAKRFKKQIFLSVDLPLSLGEGDQLVFEAEKGIVESLKAIEKESETK